VDYGRSSFAKVILYAVAVVVLIGAYFGYRKLKATFVPPPSAVVAAPKRPSTPSATLNEISEIPARAINKAKSTIAAVKENEDGRVEAVTDGENPPGGRTPRHTTPKPAVKPATPLTSTTQLAPGIQATTAASDVVGDASPAFRTWVAQARIGGVFQGSPARALINKRTVSEGQMVDETLEITFVGLDLAARTIVFRDRTGVTVVRKY
jgi:hypothetical protein